MAWAFYGKKRHHSSRGNIMYPTSGDAWILEILVWNKGSHCGLILKLLSDRDSLWSNGATDLIKDKEFCYMNIPADSSWIWRSIFKAHKHAIKFTLYVIAN